MLQSSYIAELEIDHNWRLKKRDSIKSERITKSKSEGLIAGMQYMNVGFYVLTPILVGVFIGYGIDRKFHTAPTFILVGVVLGAISAFYNLWKLTKEI